MKFSENIKDSTVEAGLWNFHVANDSFGMPVDGFSTERSDGTIDTDANDEYVTLSFNSKESITKFKYVENSENGEVTDLAGNKLVSQEIDPVN
ncbi:hypothetical protein [Bacillus mesophilum]|uniref:Uncharacterized protein n=1 Tax=Bacillus mesophilum TaxID=1071718 RepID=A0A7V7RLF6_9BACI|nr:hypothetical protein [Bacillus mesophilum]KAB2332580.1 hypothetical protein F7732_10825 [Bacillus mesophilum]